MAPLFQNNMVFQQQSNVPLWGWADPGSTIKIHTSWNNKTIRAKSDASGKFTAYIETTAAGGPYRVEISASNNIIIENVMLGEVWLCSGQSNMEMPLRGWLPKDSIINSEKEIAEASYPGIRLFNVRNEVAPYPLEKSKGEWKICTPDNAGDFSATAYFFARKLNVVLNVPIGLIQSDWGGTPVESWMPLDYLEKIERFQGVRAEMEKEKEKKDEYPSWIEGMEKYDFSDLSYEEMNNRLDTVVQSFSSFNENDNDWDEHTIPMGIEKHFGPIDPVIWYRKAFNFDGDVNIEYELFLGAVDDLDATFINGVRIGGKAGWLEDRKYPVPAGLLKKGRNVVAVRVMDNAGGGGIYRGEPYIGKGNEIVVSLSGNWKYKMAGCFQDPATFRLFDSHNNLQNYPIPSIHHQSPVVLYNAMIAPLIPYKITGAIWYQGESNVRDPEEYVDLFPLLIEGWRNHWSQGDFPFYFVQIAPFKYKKNTEQEKAAMLREAQRLTMKVTNTGMAVTSDIGNPENIHPANKQDVGKRLALWALNKAYGVDNLVYSGPLYKKMSIEENRIRIYFENTGSGLYTPDNTLTYFEIAGEDGKYYPAEAIIDGEEIVVSSSKVRHPVNVRFGWTDTATPNLFNKEGLPAASFCSETTRQ